MDVSEITPENVLSILCDTQRRDNLVRAMEQEQGSNLPLSHRYDEIARRCVATPEQLHRIVKALLRRRRYERLLCSFVAHPNISEVTLMLLFEKGRCIDELGHRQGPRSLLERVTEKYRYSEAITSLALYYYSRQDYPLEAFASFLRDHADDPMLRGNIIRSTDLPADRWEVVRALFSETADWKRVHG